MIEDKDIEKIDDYILGRLSHEDHQEFESALSNNPKLKNEVELHRKLIAGMKKFDEKQNFHHMIDEIGQDVQSQTKIKTAEPHRTKSRTILIKRILGIAAAISLLIVSMVFLVEKKDNNQIISHYFNFSKDMLTPQLNSMGAIEGMPDSMIATLRSGINAFEQRELDIARREFEMYSSTSSQVTYLSILTNFYLGQIYLEQTEFEKAFETLKPITREDTPIQSQSTWYLALSAIGTGQYSEAKLIMQSLVGHPEYDSKAKEILQMLND